LCAIEFYKSASEFLNNLENNLDHICWVTDLVGDAEYKYFIAFETMKKNILGIVKTYEPKAIRLQHPLKT